MKMKRVLVTFEKTLDVRLYAPADMADADIEELARDLAMDGLRDWDAPEWEASVGQSREVTIPDTDLKCGPPTPGYGFRRCLTPQFQQDDALVVNDDRTDMVAPEDANWWVVPEAEAAEESEP